MIARQISTSSPTSRKQMRLCKLYDRCEPNSLFMNETSFFNGVRTSLVVVVRMGVERNIKKAVMYVSYYSL